MLYDTLLYAYGKWRFKHVKRDVQRTQSHTYTCFFRAPAQLRVLAGSVVDHVLVGDAKRRLDILVFAASSGAEAYTVASCLLKARPGLDFRIVASDLHPEMVERGAAGVYSRAEVLHSDYITDEFVRETFDVNGDNFTVRRELRERVEFRQANLLDGAQLASMPAGDIVLAQNVLFHLDDELAAQAFVNVCGRLKARAALLVEGMNLDQKMALSRAHQLVPLQADYRNIYRQQRVHVPLDWWNYYYGSEPFSRLQPDRVRRFSTIFLRG